MCVCLSTSHYVIRGKHVVEEQYVLRISQIGVNHDYATSGLEGRTSQLRRKREVAQRRGAQEKLDLFRGSPRKYKPIRAKLAMNIFDEHENILKGMHSIRFNGRSDHGDTVTRPAHGRSDHGDSPVCPAWGTTSPLINSLTD